MVTINGKGKYIIKNIEKHGSTLCGCCFGSIYFLYQISANGWINENQLEPAILN